MEAMRRIADSISCLKASKIDLTDFFSLETTLLAKSINNTDVFISISFLRHSETLYSFVRSFICSSKDKDWKIIEYSICCGESLDDMCILLFFSLHLDSLLKLSFKYKGDDMPTNCCGYDSEMFSDGEPEIEEPSEDNLPITIELSEDNLPRLEMSEDEVEAEKPETEEILIEFDVKFEILQVLYNLLNPQMPPEVFLMHIVSLQYISFLQEKFVLLIELGNELEY